MRPDHSTSWLGAIGYLVLLDQLGETLRPITESPDRYGSKYPTIRRCLERFVPELTEDATAALYGLRCALAHHFGLWNPPKPNETPQPWHRIFTLVGDDASELIRHPARQWDGSLPTGPLNVRFTTVVNLRRLADLVEEVVERVRELGRAGQLEIALENPADLNFRFGVRVVSY